MLKALATRESFHFCRFTCKLTTFHAVNFFVIATKGEGKFDGLSLEATTNGGHHTRRPQRNSIEYHTSEP